MSERIQHSRSTQDRSAARSAVSIGVTADFSLDQCLLDSPFGFALTRGPEHRLVYANPAFLQALGVSDATEDVPMGELVANEWSASFATLCSRALQERGVAENPSIGPLGGGRYWSCWVWPVFREDGKELIGLAVGLVPAPHVVRIQTLQREVAERLLLSALRESDAHDEAEAARARAAVLADAGGRLAKSLDERATRDTMAGLTLSDLGSWCIVDLIESDGRVTRLDMIHRNPEKMAKVHGLAVHWSPRKGDPFGAHAVMADRRPVVINEGVDEALEAAAHRPENLDLLREIGVGAILTVPLLKEDRLLGALTFMSARRERQYSARDVELAEDLASRSADALESAKLYGEALALRERAVAASEERIRLLGTISHELRTPLNAIRGFAQILSEEIHGPLSPRQSEAVNRIIASESHLSALINNVLDFVRTGHVAAERVVVVPARDAARHAVALVAGLHRDVSLREPSAEAEAALLGDPDKVHQILLNLIGNAVKFTTPEGDISVSWDADVDTVRIHVTDTGAGIPEEKLELIFDPFVRLAEAQGTPSGAGLGLSISRDLARAMGGELTVESVVGEGSRFTLSLPRAPS